MAARAQRPKELLPRKSTLKRNLMNAYNVERLSHRRAILVHIRESILERNLRLSLLAPILPNIRESTLERNRTNVKVVERPSHVGAVFLNIRECILERNLMNVNVVERPLHGGVVSLIIREATRERNLMNLYCSISTLRILLPAANVSSLSGLSLRRQTGRERVASSGLLDRSSSVCARRHRRARAYMSSD
ncbi:zinc finger protein 781-like [Gracilinanus agilis]|uniref:zinc finger protein 781-like n=1 Tax=Gracilinanus agilis TaxID=191870 RepID=UPI001CFCE27D|nr:zinc finger protein 781-like [Gracilinanus agilis]